MVSGNGPFAAVYGSICSAHVAPLYSNPMCKGHDLTAPAAKAIRLLPYRPHLAIARNLYAPEGGLTGFPPPGRLPAMG